MVELLEAAWSVPTDALLSHYSSDRTRGLTTPQAKAHLEAFGPNELPAEEATPFWKLVLKQFDDLLVKVLLLAALTSFVLALLEEDPHSAHSAHSAHSEHSAHSDEGGLFAGLGAFVEPGVILLILAINAAVGVVQEANAEKAIEALKSYEPENAKVVRDGKVNVVPAADVVPGDIVEVARGDKIPADMRVIELQATSVRCDQAILTGESVSVPKVEEVVSDARAVNQDKVNVLFKGTTVSVGKVRCCVIGTGSTTEFGKIQGVLSETETVDSPLKVKLDEFGEMLSKVILVICILVWVINVGHFNDPVHGSFFKGAIYYFKIAVALAVAAIPEGLPAVVTTCLALGTMKMAKKKAIVRSLPSVETLGCTTVICSDKTGTLTTNMMSVSKIVTVRTSSGAIEEYDVEGSTFAPDGEVATASGDVVECPSDGGAALAKAAEISALCNDSTIHYNADTGAFEKVGEATETALKVLVEKLGHPDLAEARAIRAIPPQDRFLAVNGHWEQERPKLVTLEFSRDRKSMSVVVAGGADASAGSPALSAKSSSGSESPVRRTTRSSARRAKAASAGGRTLLCKGAPENILDRCDSVLTEKGDVVKLTKAIRQKLDARILELSTGSSTLRCLGLAYRENCEDPEDMDLSDPSRLSRYETGMTFASVVGMMDPPRAEVRGAIETCGKAGIRVIVITGDNKNTAEAICRRIGVFSEDEDVSDLSYTGREFDDMTPSEQIAAVKRARLFSRTEPAHKARLVDLLQQQGEVAAMTGDGVNDAPALKKADIGIATGTGTAVAKEASEMVLADDNFATIVAAVEEGRAIYNNTKQFIRYLISSNIGEVVSIFLASALGMPDALIPVQLLWMNLVTDGLPATALGFNPPDADIMEIAPRSSKDPIVGGWLFIRYMVIGIYIGAATCAGYAYWYLYFEGGPQISWAVLTNHLSCEGDVCKYFLPEYAFKASTVSLSVLVMIEMFNAFNSLSENQSVFVMSPFVNIWLILAVILSTVLHIAILYTPVLASIFSVAPLSMEEWKIVLWLSVPVIVVDELLKIVSRAITPKAVDLVKTKQD